MRTIPRAVAVAIAVWIVVSSSAACAQQAAGQRQGVARQPAEPKLVSLSGEVLELKTEPCRMATGRSALGAHLAIKTAGGKTVHIHLGPAAEVAPLTKGLARGMTIQSEVFRTDATPEGQYVARTLRFGDRTVVLRDKSLRPVWAEREAIPQQPLKIAVTATKPSWDAAVDPRFGRCPYFVVVDSAAGSFEALPNTNTDGRGAGVQSARMIAAKGATVLLTGKCGPSALRALSAERIEVVEGCSGTVREVLRRYQAGEIQAAGPEKSGGAKPAAEIPPP